METNTLREFDEVRIPVPWGYIAGRWYGEKNVRPILALHGWLDNYGTWDTLIPLMAPHIGVLAIDMSGHGKSSRLPPGIIYQGDQYLSDIMRVMREYNWDKVSIMAHSMSSMNAFVFASLYPDKVDLLIQFDVIYPRFVPPDKLIQIQRTIIENFMLEEERIRQEDLGEPPSYSYDELTARMYNGSSRSVDWDKCEHILRTNASRSKRYPDKYYFSRDPRLKYYKAYFSSPEDCSVMANRIKVPQLVIKGSASHYISLDDPVLKMLRSNNPYFEFHIVEGTHHVHLNNARDTSVVVNAFINKWRPPPAPAMPEVVEQRPQTWVGKRQLLRLERAKL